MTHRNDCGEIQCSYALKSRSKLRAALGNFLLHQNSSLFTDFKLRAKALKCAASVFE